MRKVRWGVISTAKIGTQKVIPGMQKSELCDIRAIASRSLDTAKAAAAELGIPKAYGSYDELLADPEIEAVYNPLPNHLHVPVTLHAAEAGKHVLCEKPIALAAAEAGRLRSAAKKVLIMEAFMVRFHPQWLKVRELVRGGRIGDPRAVQVLFSYFNVDSENIRNMADIGGGALYDIGCYPIVVSRFVFESEPLRGAAAVDRCPTFGTDRLTSGILDYGNGRQLSFTVSTQAAPFQRVQVLGELGRIEVLIPFNAPQGKETRILVDNCQSLEGAGIETMTLPVSDQYGLQGDVFSRAVLKEADLPYSVDDAIQNMRIIDALFRSEKSGLWEEIHQSGHAH
jgi:predicted dehydrogenase